MKVKDILPGNAPWPYPQSAKEKLQVVVAALLVLLVTLLGVVAAGRYSQVKVLAAEDIKQAASGLHSLAAGAKDTFHYENEGKLVGGFGRAHLVTLARQIADKTDGVAAHASEPDVQQQAAAVVKYGHLLQRLCERESDPGGKNSNPAGAERTAAALQGALGKIKDAL